MDRQVLPSYYCSTFDWAKTQVNSIGPPSRSKYEFSHGLPRLRRVRVTVQIEQRKTRIVHRMAVRVNAQASILLFRTDHCHHYQSDVISSCYPAAPPPRTILKSDVTRPRVFPCISRSFS
jgi:hypothetical protein